MKTVKKYMYILIYFIVWLALIATFWVGIESGQEMGYSIMTFYIVLPLMSLIIGTIYGQRKGAFKWILIPTTGVMTLLCSGLTFDLANSISTKKFVFPDYKISIFAMIPALIGVLVGIFLKPYSR